MKRIRPFLISILTLVGGLSPTLAQPVHAEGSYNGAKYWTVQDFIDYTNEVQAERDALCGDNPDCTLEYYVSHMDNESEIRSKFRRFDLFYSMPIVITSINPQSGEFEYLYHAVDGYDWQTMPSSTYSFNPLNELIMVWLDESVPDPTIDTSWFDPEHNHYQPYYVDEILDGSIAPTTHPVYIHSTELGDAPIMTHNTVMTGTVNTDGALEGDTRKRLFYNYRIGGSMRSESFSYRECFDALTGTNGARCDLIFTEDYGLVYAPVAADGSFATALIPDTPSDTPSDSSSDTPTTTEPGLSGTESPSDPSDTSGDTSTSASTDVPVDPFITQPDDSAVDDTREPSSSDVSSVPADIKPSDDASADKISETPSETSSNDTAKSRLDASGSISKLLDNLGKGSASGLFAPDTGVARAGNGAVYVFPWWIPTFIITGTIAIVGAVVVFRKRK